MNREILREREATLCVIKDMVESGIDIYLLLNDPYSVADFERIFGNNYKAIILDHLRSCTAHSYYYE